MIQNFLAKILLSPISFLYGIGVGLRNFMYRKDMIRGIEFDVPVISVGNMSIGGAGKSPHIEYLVRLLQPYLSIATLSRGYKRKTKGYIEVGLQHDANIVGDEPLQFKRKFPELLVTVAENRTFAIPKIMMKQPDTHAVLLDDAFQHLAVKPGLNILLTEYDRPFTQDYLLPSGRLREWRSSYKRADVIIVSKCPPTMSEEERQAYIAEIKPLPSQKMFFSYYEYDYPYYIFKKDYKVILEQDMDIELVCAIAKTDYLMDWLVEQVNTVQLLEYEDHRYFTKYDMGHVKKIFENLSSKRKMILTTEKDATRLELHKKFITDNKLPIFALPVRVAFHFDQGKEFDELIKKFLLDFKI